MEADLAWVIQKSRRVAADFPGADRILEELVSGPRLKRVGIEVTDKAPARHGTEIQLNDESIGMVTSGGFSPCLERPIAMGYVRSEFAIPGTEIDLIVRGRPRAGRICTLPFVQPNYQR